MVIGNVYLTFVLSIVCIYKCRKSCRALVGMFIYYLRYILRQVDSKQYKSDFYVPSRLGRVSDE